MAGFSYLSAGSLQLQKAAERCLLGSFALMKGHKLPSSIVATGVQHHWQLSRDLMRHACSASGKLTSLRTQHPASTSLRARPDVLSDLDSQAHQPPDVNIEELKLLIEEARNPTKSDKPRAARRTPNSAGEWLCGGCAQHLPLGAFRLLKSRPDGHPYIRFLCRDCERLYVMAFRRTLRGNAGRLVGAANYRSKKRDQSNTLTIPDILDMIWDQKGCCAYSGVSMQLCIPNSHWRMSLERKNNDIGYNISNCVLVASEFNSPDYSRAPGVRSNEVLGTAQWSAEKVSAVFEARRSTVDVHELLKDIAQARMAPQEFRLARRASNRKPDGEGNIICNKCGTLKHSDSFYPRPATSIGIRSYCKECAGDLDRQRRETLRGHVLTLLATARTRSKSANMAFALQLGDLLDMLHLQGGRCIYSGVPLQYRIRHTDWRMSLERVNNLAGYTKDNCVLIAVEFNTSDYSRKTPKEEVFGTAQWSPAKVMHIWGRVCSENTDPSDIQPPGEKINFARMLFAEVVKQ
ncbi:unnamed protein product [Polarella glacialis]|uniref:Uncharacterized protein n=1 Tax=Polarella glacialis TaxID=89957 RepID=A0A813EP04_POLGL|nr:unnamed protein product [Polarella glacialis]CAE8600113.1 unnamed protein product [Polarella glacialis]